MNTIDYYCTCGQKMIYNFQTGMYYCPRCSPNFNYGPEHRTEEYVEGFKKGFAEGVEVMKDRINE